MCDEEFLFLRSPSSPKGSRRRVRAMFVCPSCGWRLQAVLEQELTTVRCECDAQFAVRKPASKYASNHTTEPTNITRPPLRSILQQLAGGAPTPTRSHSDTDSHASFPSSVQSVMVSHCSSASSAVVSISAPSVVSISSAASAAAAERRGGAASSSMDAATRAMRVGMPQTMGDGDVDEASVPNADAKPEASGVPWLPLPSIVEGLGAGGWLGEMFANTSISSPLSSPK